MSSASGGMRVDVASALGTVARWRVVPPWRRQVRSASLVLAADV